MGSVSSIRDYYRHLLLNLVNSNAPALELGVGVIATPKLAQCGWHSPSSLLNG